jgi:hypothetical protein
MRSRYLLLGLAVLAVSSSSCSLFYESTRPVPGARHNLFCDIEYWPDPDDSDAPDILFLAAAIPYNLERV